MFYRLEKSITGKRDWATFTFLFLAIMLPGSGFVGVLAASSSEAEVEFFGEEEVEECLIVVLKQRTLRRTAARPKCQQQSRVIVSRAHYSDVSHERVFAGHRFSNGLLAPIRC